MNNLIGKTALITGAAKRLGRATALALAENGVNTVIHFKSSEGEAQTTVQLALEKGVLSDKIYYDLGNTKGLDKFIDDACRMTGSLDFIINSASIYPEDNLESLCVDKLSGLLNVNTLAPFLIAREFRKICTSGTIINFLDARMTDYEPEHISYQLSKQMLFSLTRMMSIEFAPEIRVNAVAPGIILPEEDADENMLTRLKNGNPLGRIGCDKEITDTVLFLLSNEFITGQVIYVDGGRNLRGNVYGY